jgi:hypothetical protein
MLRQSGRFQALAAPVHLPHSTLYRCTEFVTYTASSVFAMGYAFSALLVLFAVGRERTKAYSTLVPTSGLTLLRRLFHPLWGDKSCRVGNSRKS